MAKKFSDFADEFNRSDLVRKAKETNYKDFLDYCTSEIQRAEKVKIPTKIEGRSQIIFNKDSYIKCLRLVNYIVSTGDTKMSGEIPDRNIAKMIVAHYEQEGFLPQGTTDKFDS